MIDKDRVWQLLRDIDEEQTAYLCRSCVVGALALFGD
jgi:hypothetical protein